VKKIPKKWLDLLKGLARTGVPVGVAAAVTWLRARGIIVPEWGGQYAIPVASGIAYWLIVRLGEIKLSPRWGVLLLAIGQPVYETAAQALDPTTKAELIEVPATSATPRATPRVSVSGSGPDAQGLASVLAPGDDPNALDPEGPQAPGELPAWAIPHDQ